MLYNEFELQQSLFEDMSLPIDELFVELDMVAIDEHGCDMRNIIIRQDQIFENVLGKNPTRILLEGGPGYGKTTLGMKILNDWAKKKSYVYPRFRLAFFLTLRDLTLEAIQRTNFLITECTPRIRKEYSDDDIELCLRKFEHELLIILDGFDELGVEAKASVFSIINKEKLEKACVLITSRRGKFKMDETDINIDLTAGAAVNIYNDYKRNSLWDKKISIRGVSKERRQTFVERFFDSNWKTYKERVTTMFETLPTDALKSPLFLQTAVLLIQTDSVIDNIRCKTDLYKTLFQFIVKRAYIRNRRIESKETFDLFHGTDTISKNAYKEILRFGEVAYNHLENDNLSFSSEEVSDDKNLAVEAFFVKHVKFKDRKTREYSQPIHKSFLEFLVAVFLCKISQIDVNDFTQKIHQLMEKGVTPFADSLVYAFLGGLLDSDASLLFESLSPWGLLFHPLYHPFVNIMAEIKNVNALLPSLHAFGYKAYIPSNDKKPPLDNAQSAKKQ